MVDLSNIPKDVLRTLRSNELTLEKKMIAFNMLVPNLNAAHPEHGDIYDRNLRLGQTIKEMILNGDIEICGMNDKSVLSIRTLHG